jgi:hypothetical protein
VDREESAQWLPVIAKALAVLAMHRAELGNSEMSIQAEFLEGLGLPRSDVADARHISGLIARDTLARKRGGKRGREQTAAAKAKRVRPERTVSNQLNASRTFSRCCREGRETWRGDSRCGVRSFPDEQIPLLSDARQHSADSSSGSREEVS